MRAMVTGATGFTGGHLARALKAKGYEVVALVRDLKKAEPLKQQGIELVAGNLRSKDDVRRAAQGCDVVYHIAALYREARHADETYRKVNVEGVGNVIEACAELGVGRLVHCSTVGVHGNVVVPADENAPFAPLDVYQESKVEGEMLVQQYIAKGGRATVFRPVGIHGPGDTRFLKLFRAINNGTFRMIGKGAVIYHMTYIDDLVDGIVLCGEHPAALGHTYILCGPVYTTLAELATAVATSLGRKPPRGRIPLWPVVLAAKACEAICRPLNIEPPLHARRLEFFINDRGFTAAKAIREIGYKPKFSLAEGLARTAAWYRAQGMIR
jgi:dihydroflavonol-4-reductase